jgi:hypothetical protein
MRDAWENGNTVPYLYKYGIRGRFVVSFIPNPLDWRLVVLSHSGQGGENKIISEILLMCNFGVVPEEQEHYSGYNEPRGTGCL